MSMSFPELRVAVLRSDIAFVRAEHARHPDDGSLSGLLGVVMAFGDDRRAFRLSVNGAANGLPCAKPKARAERPAAGSAAPPQCHH